MNDDFHLANGNGGPIGKFARVGIAIGLAGVLSACVAPSRSESSAVGSTVATDPCNYSRQRDPDWPLPGFPIRRSPPLQPLFCEPTTPFSRDDYARAIAVWIENGKFFEIFARGDTGPWKEIALEQKARTKREIPMLRTAAARGYAPAQVALACLHSDGRALPVEDDEHAAGQWFRRAAKQDHPDGQYFLGDLYEYGAGGVDQSYIEAAKWYQLAAQHGHSDAQFALATLYREGLGVAMGTQVAAYWYNSPSKYQSRGFDAYLPCAPAH